MREVVAKADTILVFRAVSLLAAVFVRLLCAVPFKQISEPVGVQPRYEVQRATLEERASGTIASLQSLTQRVDEARAALRRAY